VDVQIISVKPSSPRKETASPVVRAGKVRDFWVASLSGTAKRTKVDFENFFEAAAGESIQKALVVTSRALFNNPAFQSLVSRHRLAYDLRFIVEETLELDTARFLKEFREMFSSILLAVEEEGNLEAESVRIHPPYLRVSKAIRNKESGRLDALMIADFFDLTPTDLAPIIGVSRQALTKTPDSKNIQKALYPFEEITRGMLMVDDDPTLFRLWLNTPSRDLPKVEGRHMTPMAMIKRGHPEVVAGLVDNTLTGHPS
jgi:hypothetical protein